MGFLGGLDLGSPEERSKRALTLHLELRRNGWTAPGEKSYVYRGGGDLVLRHGHFRMGRVLPEEWAHVMLLDGRTCFFNALKAAQADPRLSYCEGYAVIGRGDAYLHAWCVAPDDGVVEVTYPTEKREHFADAPDLPALPPNRWSYYGVTLTTELTLAHATDFSLGVLDRSAREIIDMRHRFREENIDAGHDYPLLQVPYDPNRTELP